MPKYKMKDSDYETPPENVYFFDLVGIDEKTGSKGEYLRWRWVIADVPEQEKYAGTYATSLTPCTPTVNNRFGKFLESIYGKMEIGAEGDTDSIIDSKIRVKGLLEHNKGVNNAGEDVIYCNVKKLFTGSAQQGVGIGRQDLDEDGKTKRPEKTESQPQNTEQSAEQTPPPQTEQPKTEQPSAEQQPQTAGKPNSDIPWALIIGFVLPTLMIV